MINKLFKLKENKTNVLTELLAGVTTFITMSYIIFINPTILSQTGMDYNSVYIATILTSIIGTLIMGLVANVPYVQSAGLGLNALFTYTLCGTMGFTWQQALAMVCICGAINIIITVTSLRHKIISAMPEFMKDAITVGIGLFIAYIGFKNAGILEFSVSSVSNGVAAANDVVPALARFNTPEVLLALFGLSFTSILYSKNVKGSFLIGIIVTTLAGIPLGVTSTPDFANYTLIPSIAPTFFKLDFAGLFTAKAGIIAVIMSIFTLVLSDLFDTIGTFIGTGKRAGIFKDTKDGKMSKKLSRAMFADSISTFIGSFLGTSNVTTYVESGAGIEVGGRTGLTAVFAAMCFALSLLFAPVVACVPMAAIAPILIIVGASMIENVTNIDWTDKFVLIPAFLMMVGMPFSYSITSGIEFGFISYSLLTLYHGKRKETSFIIYLFSIIFIIDFIYQAFFA